jgi:hypothetical protein
LGEGAFVRSTLEVFAYDFFRIQTILAGISFSLNLSKFLGSKLGHYHFVPHPMQAVIIQTLYSTQQLLYNHNKCFASSRSRTSRNKKLEDITMQTSTSNFM